MRVAIDAAAFGRELRRVCAAESSRVTTAIQAEVKAGGEGLRAELKEKTEAVLGRKIANAWRGKFYPNQGQAGGPAAFVWTKAPKIIDFHSSSKVVTPLGDSFAIPTASVPRGARGRRLSPIEVEARFNAELRPVKLRSGRIGLVIDLVRARSKRRPGERAATARRLAQGRAARPVLMFVLSREPLQGRKEIDLQAIAQRWGARTADNIGERIERGI